MRLVASLRIMDFEADQIDAAIRFSLKATPGLYSEVLIVDRMTPMCAPKIAASLETPEDLRKATLIHDDSMAKLPVRPVWSDWFEAAGVDGPPMDRGPRFSGADHALSAAAKGLGVVLGRTSLAGEDLRSGRLVAPFDLAIDPAAHYRFVCPEGAETRDDVAALLDWLRSVLAEGKDPLPGLRVVTPARLAAAAQ